MIKYLSYKDLCDFQSYCGNTLADIFYKLYKEEFTEYSNRILNSVFPVIEGGSYNGFSLFKQDGCLSFSINDSYYLDLTKEGCTSNESLSELASLLCYEDSNTFNIDTAKFGNLKDDVFTFYDVGVSYLQKDYDTFLRTLNCKQRANLKYLHTKSNDIEFSISRNYEHEACEYFFKNSIKHNVFLDTSDYANSQLMFPIAFSIAGGDVWFQKITKNNLVVGYSAVVDLFKNGELIFYANCTDCGLGTLAIENFIKYFCGSQYTSIDCVIRPDYPWEEQEESNIYKKKISNGVKNIKVLSLISCSEDEVSSYSKPFFRKENSKFYL